MTGIVENPDGVSPMEAQTLQIISGAMGGGLTVMAGLVAWSYSQSAGRVPTVSGVRFINLMTALAMLFAVSGIVASEILWRRLLKSTSGGLGGRVRTPFIVRLACREGAGFVGLTVAYLAALNGVLRSYPAYWVNLAPYGFFLGFLAAHWPTADHLAAEAREILGSQP